MCKNKQTNKQRPFREEIHTPNKDINGVQNHVIREV